MFDARKGQQRVVETTYEGFTSNVLEQTLRACPAKYRANLGPSLKDPTTNHTRAFLVSTATWKAYREALMARIGAQVVDPDKLMPGVTYEEAVKRRRAILRNYNKSTDGLRYGGIPVVVWPGVPDNKVIFASSHAHDAPEWTEDMLITLDMENRDAN